MTTITLPRATVEQALEALELVTDLTNHDDEIYEAIAALRAALAQQAEPVKLVAWVDERAISWLASRRNKASAHITTGLSAAKTIERTVPLYTAPPQRKPLTDEEIQDAVREADLDWQKGWTLDEHESNRFTTLVRAVERAHGIGGQDAQV